jgi:hypothetical protein
MPTPVTRRSPSTTAGRRGPASSGPSAGGLGLDAVADGFDGVRGAPATTPQVMAADIGGLTMDNAAPWLRDGLSEVLGHLRPSGYFLGDAPARTSSQMASDFIAQAQSRKGATYRWGGKPRSGDANPSRMDCSGLVQWAAARVGKSLPAGSMEQLAATHRLSVEKAINTPGALLFKKGSSLESRYPMGVVEGSAYGRFTHSGWIPGMSKR